MSTPVEPPPPTPVDAAPTGHTPVEKPPVDVERLRERLHALMPGVRGDLERLVRIPSVSAPAFDQAHVQTGADAVEALLRDAGLTDVRQLRVALPGHAGSEGADSAAGTGGADSAAGTEGSGGASPVLCAPAVVARQDGPDGAPTVLLYAHHDVQPPGPDAAWDSPPFEPTERDGRLYGRGAADDKAGLMVHVAALRTLGEELGVGLVVFVEGEEEIGSPSFAAFLAEHRELLAADVIVVADSVNWRVGVPALTTSLRGLVDGTITVRTLDHAVHSGMYGGPVPDAMLATVRLLDTLWDERGDVAVAGLVSTDTATPEYPEADLRADAGVLDGVELVGTGSLASRLWTRPALTVVGVDATTVAEASNTLLPAVRVKFSMRIAPGQDPADALAALREHVSAHAPFGARVQLDPGEAGQAFAADVEGPVYRTARWALEQAWGTAPVQVGIGGSIPFIADLVEAYPGATVLVTGVEDPDSRAHGANESLHLAEFERACLAEILLLAALAPGR